MRVLILSANTGGGHNSAAKAVKEALEHHQAECATADTLSFVSELVSDIVCKGHNNLYKYFPELFGVGYRFAENHSPKLLYDSMTLGAKKLSVFIKEGQFDAIVCTHVFASMMVTEAHKKYDLAVPQYFVSTDYTCYPGVSTIDAEGIFMPAEGLRQEYLDGGADESRLIVANGIPILPVFRHPPEKGEARNRLGLPETGRIVLLCCGSMGAGNIHRVVPDFAAQLPEDALLVVVCGHNERTYQQLTENPPERTVVVGFTDRMVDYMAAADVCVSKPGGLSITEMLSLKVPMVLVLAVPGCETRNLDFLERQELAVRAETWEDAAVVAADLLRHPEKLTALRERMGETDFSSGAETIATVVVKRNEQK